jgi:non-heme chloroperoxidase
MSTITTNEGTEIYYKNWGPKTAPPIVFHHGWPLSADDWTRSRSTLRER